MSISQALSISMSGLAAKQAALAVVSQNIANANTDGYSRKVVAYNALLAGNQSSGVAISSIERVVSTQLTSEMNIQNATLSRLDTMDTYFTQIQNLFGTPDSTTGLDARISALTESLQYMATDPSAAGNKQQVVNAASVLTNDIRNISTSLQDMRNDADQQIADAVSTLNDNLKTILQTNDALLSMTSGANSGRSDIEDKRDAAIKSINEILGVRAISTNSDGMAIYLSTGQVLTDGETAVNVTFQQTSNIQPGMAYTDGVSTPPYGIFLDDGTQTINITSLISDGKLRALLDLRDNVLPGLQDQVEDLATSIKETVNRVHNDGASTDPASDLVGTVQLGSLLTGDDSATRDDILDAQLPFAQGLVEFAVTDQTTGQVSNMIQIDLDQLAKWKATQSAQNGTDDNLPTMRDVLYLINLYGDPPATWDGSGSAPPSSLVTYQTPAGTTVPIQATVDPNGRLEVKSTAPGKGVIVNSNPTVTSAYELESPQTFLTSGIPDDALPVTSTAKTITTAATATPGELLISNTNELSVGDTIVLRAQLPSSEFFSVVVKDDGAGAPDLAQLVTDINALTDSNSNNPITATLAGTQITLTPAGTTTNISAEAFNGGALATDAVFTLDVTDPSTNASELAGSMTINLRALQELIYDPDNPAYQSGGVYTPPALEVKQIIAAINGDFTTLDAYRQANNPATFGTPVETNTITSLAQVQAVITSQDPPLNTSFGYPIPSTVTGQPGLADLNITASLDSSTGQIKITALDKNFQLAVSENDLGGKLDFPSPSVGGSGHIGLASTSVASTSTADVSASDTLVDPSAGLLPLNTYFYEVEIKDRTDGSVVSRISVDIGALQRAVNIDQTTPTVPVTIADLMNAVNGFSDGQGVIASQFPSLQTPLPTSPGTEGGPGLVGGRMTIQDGKLTILSDSDTSSISVVRNPFEANSFTTGPTVTSVIMKSTQPATVSVDPNNPRQGNVSYFFGLNDFFVADTAGTPNGTVSQLIKVRDDLVADPGHLSNGVLRTDLSGNPQTRIFRVLPGDGTTATAMDAALTGKVVIGGATQNSIISYAGQIVAENATQANNVSTQYSYQQNLVDTLQSQISSISGVNMDEELSALITLQSAYSASARVVTAVQQMYDTVIQMVQ